MSVCLVFDEAVYGVVKQKKAHNELHTQNRKKPETPLAK